MTNEPREDLTVERKGGGVVRIVIGIVLIAFVVLGTLGNAATGQLATSGGLAETLGATFARLVFLALGIVLLVSGIRARGRAR
jgi:lipopolysaccharide export LptBFGC system permease protein LptF